MYSNHWILRRDQKLICEVHCRTRRANGSTETTLMSTKDRTPHTVGWPDALHTNFVLLTSTFLPLLIALLSVTLMSGAFAVVDTSSAECTIVVKS